jgi:tetratricopeptide (TPR) repeat protein
MKLKQFFTAKTIRLLILLAILIITSLSYLTCLTGELVGWDDQAQVSNNLDVKYWSLISVRKIFTNFYAGMYQPLATLSFALENKFWHSFPLFLHLDNLLLHLINIILAYWLTKKLFKKSSLALLSAAAFAVHPIQVETVAWVSARSNLLYTGLALSALIAYTAYCQNQKLKNYLIASGFFILALLSKAPAVVLPLVMLTLDYYHRRPNTKKLLIEKIPLIILSLGGGWVAIQGRGLDGLAAPIAYSWLDKITFFTYSPLSYLQKILLPYNLSPFYALPGKINGHLPIIFYLSVPACLLLAGLVIKYRRRRSIVLGAAWFWLLVLPSTQIKIFTTTLTADRYAYLAGLGIFWLAGLAILSVWEHFKNLRKILIAALLISFLFLAIQTNSQAAVWKNSVRLWTDIIERNPKSVSAYINLGNAKSQNNDIKGAQETYQQALAMDKQNYFIYNNLGVLFAEKMSAYQEAIGYYDRAIELNPREALFYYNRASALIKLNRLPEALQDAQTAVKLKSGEKFYNYAYLNNLANLEYRLGLLREAERDYTRIINNEPQLADPYWFRGLTRIKLNNPELGCQDLKQANRFGYQDNDDNYAKNHCPN